MAEESARVREEAGGAESTYTLADVPMPRAFCWEVESGVIAKDRGCAGRMETAESMGATGSPESENLSLWSLRSSVP